MCMCGCLYSVVLFVCVIVALDYASIQMFVS